MNYKTKGSNFKTILTAVLFALTIISAAKAQEMTPSRFRQIGINWDFETAKQFLERNKTYRN